MKSAADSMMPLSIDDIIQGVDVPLDVYIRLNDEKFVLAMGLAPMHLVGTQIDKRILSFAIIVDILVKLHGNYLLIKNFTV